jgi:hypothetical protein
MSKTTLTNTDCSSNSLGNFSTNVANNVLLRYGKDNSTTAATGNINLHDYNNQGDHIITISGNSAISNSSTEVRPKTLIVLNITGKATIKSNITYHNGPYSGINELPQVIIVAKDIDIDPNVTRIDAWLVATGGADDGTSSPKGVINTCTSVSDYGSLDANTCSNPLIINGPVMAGQIKLHRTYGAGTGSASATPAEIFNLRTDTYMWAYYQAQEFSQSIVTYSREVAPRY